MVNNVVRPSTARASGDAIMKRCRSEAFVGGNSKGDAVRYNFDGRRLICRLSWKYRLFFLSGCALICVGCAFGLVHSMRASSPGIDIGKVMGLLGQLFGIGIGGYVAVWACVADRVVTFDFVAHVMTLRQKDILRSQFTDVLFTDMASMRIEERSRTLVDRDLFMKLRRRPYPTYKVVKCYILEAVTKNDDSLKLLETTNHASMVAIGDIIEERLLSIQRGRDTGQ